MKKIKLLTGLSTLSILGISGLPLTSCNKNTFDGKVTNAEWNAALDYLMNKDFKSNWKMSDGDAIGSVSKTSEGTVVKDVDGIIVAGQMDKAVTHTSSEQGFFYGVNHKNWWTTYEWHGDKYHGSETEELSATIESLQTIFKYYYDLQDQLDFNKDTGIYSYDGEYEGTLFLNTQFKFNKDKKISFVQSTLTETDGTSSYLCGFKLNPIYGNASVELPDLIKTKVNNHCFDMVDTTLTIDADKIKDLLDDDDERYFIDISPAAFTWIKADLNNTFYDVEISRDNKVLEVGSDFTISGDRKTITFTTPITKENNITLACYNDFDESSYPKQVIINLE